MGLEALSRGAASCRLRRDRPRRLPRDRRATSTSCALTGARVVCQDVARGARDATGARTTSCSRPAVRDMRTRPPRPVSRARRSRPTALLVYETAAAVEPRSRDCRCVPRAGTAPHGLRCSSSDHRDLPRHVRPGHQRPRRRDQRARRRSSTASSSASSAARSTRRRLFSLDERVELRQGRVRRRRRTSRSTSSASSSSTSRAGGRRG